MASTTQTIQKHYLRILRTWPTDHLRGLTIAYTIPRRLALRSLPSTSTTSTPAPPPTPTSPFKLTSTPTTPAPSRPLTDAQETASLNALYSLLENRYTERYPTSEAMLRPGFKEGYYEELARELEEAPTRGWWARTWLKWGKLVRFT